jgi:hypothetical protein
VERLRCLFVHDDARRNDEIGRQLAEGLQMMKERILDEMSLLDSSGFGVPLYHFLGSKRNVRRDLSLNLGHGSLYAK